MEGDEMFCLFCIIYLVISKKNCYIDNVVA